MYHAGILLLVVRCSSGIVKGARNIVRWTETTLDQGSDGTFFLECHFTISANTAAIHREKELHENHTLLSDYRIILRALPPSNLTDHVRWKVRTRVFAQTQESLVDSIDRKSVAFLKRRAADRFIFRTAGTVPS